MTVVWLDDDRFYMDDHEDSFRAHGLNLIKCTTPSQALRAIRQGNQNLLLDIEFPNSSRDGIIFLNEIVDLNLSVKTVILTGYPKLDEALQLSKSNKVLDYIQKPIPYDETGQQVFFNRLKSNFTISDIQSQSKNMENEDVDIPTPIQTLKLAIDKVPFVKYALGIAGVAAAVAIVKSFGIENSSIPLFSILIMLGLMVLLFLFSLLTKANEKVLRIGGYFLVFTTVFITCASALLLFTSAFFDYPKSLTDYRLFDNKSVVNTTKAENKSIETEVINPVVDSLKIHVLDSEKRKFMLDSIIHILKPVTKETFKIVPKGISSSTLVKEELIADKPDIVIAHLHSFGSQDHGFESELTKLIEGYSSANSHRTEFIVFSRSFEDGTAYYMDSMSTRLDTVRQNIHPIYLPAASEINSLHQEELRNLFKSLTTKS